MMSNDNFQTPVTCGTHSGKGTAHKDEGETYSNASPGMTNSQSVCPRLDISGVPQPTHSDDTDAHSSGNDSAERESEGHMGREASTCSSHNGKGSTTETTESKSSNGNSPSPPSSSVSFSLLSGSSEQDQPTSQAPSGDQPARLETQGELLKALRELKVRMPPEWRRKGRSSTLASLQYALSCVKQVRANQEYYHQWSMEESHGCCLDLSSFTIEELDNITSEYTLQNTDTFSVAVSFLSGKVVYISSQAAPLLRCKPKRLQGAVFLELLAPQDISTFYSSTAPCHLPPWSSCAGTTSQVECAEEKSMFCRISRGRDSDGDVKYYPFRLTPYQLTLRDSDTSQPEPCCLLITERVHSGYEAPRIPADKRIFTTSHTPNCLFQEIDERAVPLLGYLPQDLVGKPVLIYLHPEDRLLMVATHKKILQFAGQPFNHSPLRMRARSGEYLTLDTSWSSFINPWSRKVAFIVGRHKVRTSPLNEDVFTALEGGDVRTMSPDVPQLNELIHRVLVQPVHASSSQGYGSLGSSGSNEHQQSTTSSSESNGHASEDQIKPRKPVREFIFFQSRCTHNNIAETLVVTEGSKVVPAAPAHPLTPLALHCKAESVASATSQCSFSSTIVHVGDKKPPESGLNTFSSGGNAGKGLTKAVLSAHTQQEEQAFLNRFRDINHLRMVQPRVNCSQNYPSVGNSSSRRHGRGGKRRKHQVDGNTPDSPSPSGPSPYRGSNPAAARPNLPSVQQSSTSWPPSAASQTSGTPMMTFFPPGYMPMFPISSPFSMPQMGTDPSLQAGVPRFPMQGFTSVMPPVMTFMLPNYMFPQLGYPGPQLNPANSQLGGQLLAQMNPLGQFPSSAVGLPSFNPAMGQFNPLGSQMNPAMPTMIPQQFYNPNPLYAIPNSQSMPAGNTNTVPHGQSRSSTPQSTGQQAGEREGTGSPLFQSRCSSPLNLLQLEELQSNRTDTMQQTPPPGGGGTQGGGTVVQISSNRSNTKDGQLDDSEKFRRIVLIAFSMHLFSLDFLISGSSNTSKYFGSIDSSENDHNHKPASKDLGGEQFIKFVLQDPIWLLMANTDDKVMMTYQIPIKDRESVLKEDRDALKAVQKHQPHFTEEQKKELTQVHPWFQTGCLPKAINVTSCTGCESPPDSSNPTPFDMDFHEMDLSMVLGEEAKQQDTFITAETAFPLSPPSSDNEQRDNQASAST
uniref:Period circadian protein homolog 1-like n=1 Tax=Sinocyclocheilus anshuiensis TaxID=1608454 RepID=A0A671QE46_9TELE